MTAGANMLLEDVLAVLGRVGTVTLRKGTNDTSATPGHKANTTGWTCEIALAGYLGLGGSRAAVGSYEKGLTATESASACIAALEEYLEGPKGQEGRARYIQHHELYASLAGKRSDPFNGRHPKPGKLIPEATIEWGD